MFHIGLMVLMFDSACKDTKNLVKREEKIFIFSRAKALGILETFGTDDQGDRVIDLSIKGTGH